MAINVDMSEVADPSAVGEYRKVKPGKAHVQVIEVKENVGKSGEHLIKVEVLAHDDINEVGETHEERLPATSNMAWKLLEFCYAMKIADKTAMKLAKDNGQQYAPIELMNGVGRQFFCSFQASGKDGKNYINISYPRAIDDPSTKDYPRNAAQLAIAMNNPNAATSPARQTVSSAADPFKGF